MLLKIRQVAERLNLSLSKTYELVAKGEIESYKLDGAVRVEESALSAYLDSCRHGRRQLWPERYRPVKLKHLK